MALDSYTALLTAVASNWMHRADLAARAEDFVDLFESDFNSTVRARQMEQQTSIASTSGYLVHPSQWRQWKQLTLSYGGLKYNLTPITQESQAINLGTESAASTPRYFKVVGSKTYLYPAPSSSVTVDTTYYEGVTALTTANGSNWLLADYPGAYLYGALSQAAAFTKEEPRADRWQAQLDATLRRLLVESDRSGMGSQVLQMKVDVAK